MAEFQEVMRQWKRMCDTYTTDDAIGCCKGCPMAGRGCGSIYESGNADPDVIERETMTWAAENPEPVYPTWGEWLSDKYNLAYNDDFILAMSREYIPADIAKKLGIEPKEG